MLMLYANRMEFLGFVKDHISLMKGMNVIIGSNLNFPFVHVKNLPEVMLFSVKYKSLCILEVMKGKEGLNGK
jgi:hypothetical protein